MINPVQAAVATSLGLLTLALGFLAYRGYIRYVHAKVHVQLMWASGLALAAGAMAIETVVYVGFVDSLLLQAYVFLSAALVGILSLGATRALRSPRFESVYRAYTLAACGLVGVASFSIPVPTTTVVGGVISGNPPFLLLLFSIFVTGPATVVLLYSAVVALRKSRKWQTLLVIAGALVLGAGGTLYIASFPVALYYAEFVGIVLLFFGIISLQRFAASVAAPVPLGRSYSQ